MGRHWTSNVVLWFEFIRELPVLLKSTFHLKYFLTQFYWVYIAYCRRRNERNLITKVSRLYDIIICLIVLAIATL